MSEDVSATMRVGITVILVAALVATVLNLMVMSNSLLSGGQTTLQSGIDSVSTQEFATYDNTKVSGTAVQTALSMFQGRDVAIIIETKAFAVLNTKTTAINYGAILTKDGQASNGSANMPAQVSSSTNSTFSTPTTTFITSQAKTAYEIMYKDEAHSESTQSLWREDGAAFYTGYLHNTNGLVDTSYDVIGTTELGNSAYLLSSARFSSVLIKDPSGAIIGIFFRQLN